MIVNYFKKKMFEGIVKEAIASLPDLKDLAIVYWEQHKDEILEEAKKKIVEIIKQKIGC